MHTGFVPVHTHIVGDERINNRWRFRRCGDGQLTLTHHISDNKGVFTCLLSRIDKTAQDGSNGMQVGSGVILLVSGFEALVPFMSRVVPSLHGPRSGIQPMRVF